MADKLRVAEFGLVVLGAIFSAFFALNAMHADRTEFKLAELELKKQIITNELNRDHFARRRYESLRQQGVASDADNVRYDYLTLDIRNKEAEKELVEEQIKKFTK